MNKETLDYVSLTLPRIEYTHQLKEMNKTGAPSIQPENGSLKKPIVNHSFKKDEWDWTKIHRKLSLIKEEKLEKMCKEETIKDMLKRCSKRFNHNKKTCLICIIGSKTSLPKGITINTDNLRPGELIHLDFYFLNEISI